MNRVVVIVGILALTALNLLLAQLSPRSNPLIILAVLALGYLVSLAVIYLLLLGWFWFWGRVRREVEHKTKTSRRRKVLELALVLAFLPILSLLLHTMAYGRWWVLLLATLALGGCLCLWRKKPKNP
jgi:hypothetical protein